MRENGLRGLRETREPTPAPSCWRRSGTTKKRKESRRMNNTTLDIEKLASWGPTKEIQTRAGRRLLRTAAPTDAFSAAWRAGKEAMKAAGLSWSKDERSGNWSVCWWQPIGAEQAAKENAAIEASRATDADIIVPTPEGLALLPFQRAGVKFMSERSATLLGDSMGLGKTVQVIALANLDPSIKRILVVCPASLKINWRNEMARWLTRPLKVAVQVAGTPWVGGQVDVVILNYDVLAKFPEIYAEEWDLLAVDEASFVKNPKAKRTKLLLGAQSKKAKGEFPCVRAKRRVFMTGTPILNRPIEIFPLLRSLEPGKWTFKDQIRYCAGVQGRWGWDFSGASNLDELQRRLRSGCLLRRLKSEVMRDLPTKRRQVIEMPTNGESGLVQEERNSFDRHEAGLVRLKAAAEVARLVDDEDGYKAAVDALKRAYRVAFEEIAKVRHEIALAKVEKVTEHVTAALEDTGKVVLFAHHLDVIEAYRAALAEFGSVVVTGETPQDKRQGIIDQFNAGQGVRVLVLGIMAAGMGLSVKASVEIFAEMEWVPGVMSQAEDRCHGIGRGIEGEPLLVQHLVLEGSLDAKMARTIVAKQDVADRALDKGAGLVVGMEPVLTVEVGSVLDEATGECGRLQRPDPSGAATAKDGAKASVLGAGQTLVVSEDLRLLVHYGLKRMAGMDADHARDLNGAGFNKFDCAFGHALAERERLTDKMVSAGLRLCRKYSRQLGPDYAEELAALIGGRA